MQMTPPLWQKVKRNSKHLDESERGESIRWLKAPHAENEDHGIWSHHFMANRWETMETMRDFIFKLYITVLVLPNIKMNLPQVYMCSPS